MSLKVILTGRLSMSAYQRGEKMTVVVSVGLSVTHSQFSIMPFDLLYWHSQYVNGHGGAFK